MRDKHIDWWNQLPVEVMGSYKDRLYKALDSNKPMEDAVYLIWVEKGCPEPMPIESIGTPSTDVIIIFVGLFIAVLAVLNHCNLITF